MAQLSGFWTTTTDGIGHQQESYTQAQVGIAGMIYAACMGFEGVALDYLGELEASVLGVNEIAINAGGAMVDGRWYLNDASESVNIPSAGGSGNTRIDRVVIRCNWSQFKAEIVRIAGVDAADPEPPAIESEAGSVYDIKLYQVLVDTSGNIQLTDERVWAVFELPDNSVTEEKIGDGEVTNEKLSGGIEHSKLAGGITNDKLADPYDVAILKAADPDAELEVVNNLITLPVPDIWGGKTVVRLWARLTGSASSSGSVTIRVYNETKSQTVGTITISQGNRIGSTTSITNPSVSANNILRIDVTGAGTGAMGLDVQVKVNKA